MAEPETEDAASLAGRRFRVRDHYEVGREKVREFARAVQNHHDAHYAEPEAHELGYDSVVAPPTFASVIGMAGTKALLDTVLTDYDLTQMLQTDQVFEMHKPIVAGDSVRSWMLIESIRQFADNDFITVQFELANQHDELLQIGSTTLVARRGAEVDPHLIEAVEKIFMHSPPEPEPGDPLRHDTLVPIESDANEQTHISPPRPVHTAPKFDELTAGDHLPAGTASLTRGDLTNYAGVAGDPNPIHFSERAAELVGLPTVVAHGMLTMGLAAEYLTAWLGDPTAFEKFSVRFSGFVPVRADGASTIEFTGKIKSLDPERRTGTIVLGGTSEGRKLFGRAIAEVRFS
ncbi:fused (3R)-hydroxyacyl-ACP dehydratase subunits HadA/HadB [Nocardia xishanensis]|uniref:fused (3R)-hydroxyacyl-ACP dehydratase subunits HadA/HadB n=1 Tax=Nocardia xishanensis TaxID=238964 RepID=UPI00340056F8